jgi:hypothetical protein
MTKDKNINDIGVITEQGFVAGSGLGFNPVQENELNPSDKKKDNTKKDESK